jgi:NAD+ diphosphatase
MTCEQCRTLLYPRIAPCVIVLVTRGEEMLLARNARFPRPMYSTLAGFIEPGESAEETLRREVQEEVVIKAFCRQDLYHLLSINGALPT